MAKAKKSETETGDTKPAAKKNAAKAADKPAASATPGATAKAAAPKAKKSSPGAAPAGVPMIDTSLAASAAARMLLNRAVAGGGAGATSQDAPRTESTGFKNLKQNLSKPAGGSLDSLLNNAGN